MDGTPHSWPQTVALCRWPLSSSRTVSLYAQISVGRSRCMAEGASLRIAVICRGEGRGGEERRGAAGREGAYYRLIDGKMGSMAPFKG
eukprot:131458-Chlamydomonas_euryale.AAC.1